MKTIFAAAPQGGSTWSPAASDPWFDLARRAKKKLLASPAAWRPPVVEWIEEHDPPTVTMFSSMPCIRPCDNEDLASFLSAAQQFPLAGDAEGWCALRFDKSLDLGLDPMEFATSWDPRTHVLDPALIPQSYVGGVRGIPEAFVSIEDTSDNLPETSWGLRRWCRHHEVSGLLFHTVWREDGSAEYHPRWLTHRHFDASVLH